MRRHTPCAAALVATGAALLAFAQAEVAVLYDPASPGTLPDQGFEKLSSDLFNQEGFYARGADGTDFDSGPGDDQFASFFTHGLFTGNQLHPAAQTLDRTAGFKIRFDLAIDAEAHTALDPDGDGTPDESGFSIAVVSSDLQGIAFGFWTDRVFAREDDSGAPEELFAQAEASPQTPEAMAALRTFEIEVKGGGYRLRIDGATALAGRLRDYSNFEGVDTGFGVINNFDKPNSISLGDASLEARSVARIGMFTSETPYSPPDEEDLGLSVERVEGGVKLRWAAVPGRFYSLRSSDDLEFFEEFADATPDAFRGEATDTRPLAPRRFYEVAPAP